MWLVVRPDSKRHRCQPSVCSPQALLLTSWQAMQVANWAVPLKVVVNMVWVQINLRGLPTVSPARIALIFSKVSHFQIDLVQLTAGRGFLMGTLSGRGVIILLERECIRNQVKSMSRTGLFHLTRTRSIQERINCRYRLRKTSPQNCLRTNTLVTIPLEIPLAFQILASEIQKLHFQT